MVDEKFVMDGFNRVLDAMDNNLERRFNERIDGLEQHMNALEQRMDKLEIDIAGLKQGQQTIVERLDKIGDKFEIVLEMYGEHEMELRDIGKRLRRLEDNYTSMLKEDGTYDND